MANDIIDINVYETTETVEITVNPNLTTVNINQITSSSGGANLTTSQTLSNFTINSDTGTDASVPLGNGTLAGASLNDYTTAEKNKLVDTYTKGEVDTKITDSNYWTKTENNIKNNNTGNVEISVTGTAVSNLIQGAIVSTALTSSANNNSLVSLDVKGSFNTGSFTGVNKILFRAFADNILRTALRDNGTQVWTLNDGSGEVGSIVYGTPAGNPGIIFINNIGTGRSDIRHIINGGITIATGTTGSMPSNQFYFYPTGNFAINQSTDAGYRLDINGTTRLNGIVTATSSITANSFVKSGGTSSQILAADGSIITAGNNITITGGQISSVGGAGGGGSSVNYYLNGGTSQGDFGGTTYYEFSKTPVIGTGADFNRNTNGYIASFITDVADPSLLLIPAGNWNLEFFFSSSSAGGSPSFYAELYKYDGTTFTLIASGSAAPEGITNGTSIDAYFTALAVPETVLTVNDRLAIRVYVNASSKTITLHTQNGHLCEVITTFTAGLTALNGLQAQVQNFAVGTSGTDFAINSSASTHTFNLPTASASNRGALSSANWTTFNSKQDTITLTTTGTSGASTLVGATLNIPQYSGATNLGYTPSPTNGTVTSSTGSSATLSLADATNAGLLKPAKFTVLENTSGTNTGDQDLSGYALLASPTFTGTPSLPTGTIGVTQTAGDNSTKIATTAFVSTAVAAGGVTVSGQDTFGTANIATVTAAQYAAFVTAGTVSATTLYFITA
jgi:hypothetical protein